MMYVKGLPMLPGSFDPPTNVIIDIIERSAKLYEKLYVVVADMYRSSVFHSR